MFFHDYRIFLTSILESTTKTILKILLMSLERKNLPYVNLVVLPLEMLLNEGNITCKCTCWYICKQHRVLCRKKAYDYSSNEGKRVADALFFTIHFFAWVEFAKFVGKLFLKLKCFKKTLATLMKEIEFHCEAVEIQQIFISN